MFWHERRQTDPAHQFLRAEIARVARGLPKSGGARLGARERSTAGA
jgi:hypothetical protein